jgi:tetratricopeptide (TPR) repeat protein
VLALGDLAEGIELLEQAVEVGGADPPLAAVTALAAVYTERGDLVAALALLEADLERALADGDDLRRLRVTVLLAEALSADGVPARADALLRDVAGLSAAAGEAAGRARLLFERTRTRRDAAARATCAQRGVETLDAEDDRGFAARSLELRAEAALGAGDGKAALELLDQARGLCASRGPGRRASAEIARGSALRLLGRRDQAAATLAVGIARLERAEPGPEAGSAYADGAKLAHALGERALAIELCEEALRLPSAPAVCRRSAALLAQLLEDVGRRDDSMAALRRALGVTESAVESSL